MEDGVFVVAANFGFAFVLFGAVGEEVGFDVDVGWVFEVGIVKKGV